MRELCFSARVFGELLAAAPPISRTVLAQRPKELAQAGVIHVESKDKGKGHLYRLTPAGEGFRSIVELMSIWRQRWGQGLVGSNAGLCRTCGRGRKWRDFSARFDAGTGENSPPSGTSRRTYAQELGFRPSPAPVPSPQSNRLAGGESAATMKTRLTCRLGVILVRHDTLAPTGAQPSTAAGPPGVPSTLPGPPTGKSGLPGGSQARK
jgi:DNA-binding HxlR family transcriptional regulator